MLKLTTETCVMKFKGPVKIFLTFISNHFIGVVSAQMSQKSFSHVNSGYDEQAPIMSPDGKVLYWTVANHPDNVAGKRDLGDIWYSIWTGEEWSLAIHGGKVINDEGYNSVVGFSN